MLSPAAIKHGGDGLCADVRYVIILIILPRIHEGRGGCDGDSEVLVTAAAGSQVLAGILILALGKAPAFHGRSKNGMANRENFMRARWGAEPDVLWSPWLFCCCKNVPKQGFGGYLWDMYIPGAPDRGALPRSCSSASVFTAGIISLQAGFKDFLDASISFNMQRLIICHNSIKPRLQTLMLLFI